MNVHIICLHVTDGSTIPLACVSLLVRGNLSATHVVLLGYPNSYIKQKNLNAICILYKSALQDHKEELCFLSGGFRRSPTNEEKKELGRGCEKICLWGWKLTDSYLYWLNWHLSLNKLPPCQPNFKIGAIKSIDTPPALHIQTVLYYDQFNLGNINKCTNSKTIPI